MSEFSEEMEALVGAGDFSYEYSRKLHMLQAISQRTKQPLSALCFQCGGLKHQNKCIDIWRNHISGTLNPSK
jgi:hypothetical protein